jgi:Txe/YoeB family toxin of Txe-Axe toxin-antitoxin module
MAGFWSRCIGDEHRLVYAISEKRILIARIA